MSSVYNDKMAFIHVPKTAGSWVVLAMEAGGVEFHWMAAGPAGHAGWDRMPSRPFRFGFVRHPAMWLRSFWAFVRTTDQPLDGSPLEQLAFAHGCFADFAEVVCTKHPGVVSLIYRDLLGPPGAIEFVGHYESLVNDLLSALTQADVVHNREAILAHPPFNVSDRKPDLTPDLCEMIEVSEPEAMQRFYPPAGSTPLSRETASPTGPSSRPGWSPAPYSA